MHFANHARISHLPKSDQMLLKLCQMADITFMALHGSIGENGKLQATFDNLGIKYTGPNSLGCTLSMNKLVTKQIFKPVVSRLQEELH